MGSKRSFEDQHREEEEEQEQEEQEDQGRVPGVGGEGTARYPKRLNLNSRLEEEEEGQALELDRGDDLDQARIVAAGCQDPKLDHRGRHHELENEEMEEEEEEDSSAIVTREFEIIKAPPPPLPLLPPPSLLSRRLLFTLPALLLRTTRRSPPPPPIANSLALTVTESSQARRRWVATKTRTRGRELPLDELTVLGPPPPPPPPPLSPPPSVFPAEARAPRSTGFNAAAAAANRPLGVESQSTVATAPSSLHKNSTLPSSSHPNSGEHHHSSSFSGFGFHHPSLSGLDSKGWCAAARAASSFLAGSSSQQQHQLQRSPSAEMFGHGVKSGVRFHINGLVGGAPAAEEQQHYQHQQQQQQQHQCNLSSLKNSDPFEDDSGELDLSLRLGTKRH
ncbi:formin-like protein 14 [Selaginella moellendorffii]|uniref:formin-like protein 14 n=1 Tax=Selaginella moellendorffii TaxID=88036 RepID=UPI000D1C556A|nr:formin-like protein 14 [Selaginella moellendorffii]|eukprot:XP_024521546.1 formin-like protein 14 [Selaginella moellendorffii]